MIVVIIFIMMDKIIVYNAPITVQNVHLHINAQIVEILLHYKMADALVLNNSISTLEMKNVTIVKTLFVILVVI